VRCVILLACFSIGITSWFVWKEGLDRTASWLDTVVFEASGAWNVRWSCCKKDPRGQAFASQRNLWTTRLRLLGSTGAISVRIAVTRCAFAGCTIGVFGVCSE